jgi:hypothetical protein
MTEAEEKLYIEKITRYWQFAHEIVAQHPEHDAGDLVHILQCLESSPRNRLEEGLRFGRAADYYRRRAGIPEEIG